MNEDMKDATKDIRDTIKKELLEKIRDTSSEETRWDAIQCFKEFLSALHTEKMLAREDRFPERPTCHGK